MLFEPFVGMGLIIDRMRENRYRGVKSRGDGGGVCEVQRFAL